ncbi:hypothetical protein [Nocardioides sp. B-3]|uniref:hypothetical protein n=1 Tax=Nocardioides sp. B-3 TaxID=2895565 RepID=UPI00215285F5|nr:hypothetical protein [Nocardioides sp. B-3]UUZ57602.1 hypothetical protein LP418_14115 [Nocardioides sp. B-3]
MAVEDGCGSLVVTDAGGGLEPHDLAVGLHRRTPGDGGHRDHRQATTEGGREVVGVDRAGGGHRRRRRTVQHLDAGMGRGAAHAHGDRCHAVQDRVGHQLRGAELGTLDRVVTAELAANARDPSPRVGGRTRGLRQ